MSREMLHARLTGPGRPVLVEALGAAFYEDAHIPGAINIPPGQVDELAHELLPDRGAEIVVYCSRSSASSVRVARRLEELGYTTVAVYEGGKEEWVEHGLPVERLDGGDPEADSSSRHARARDRRERRPVTDRPNDTELRNTEERA